MKILFVLTIIDSVDVTSLRDRCGTAEGNVQMDTTIPLLEELSNALGISGFESEVRDVIEARLDGLVDEVRTDTLGNLIATRHGSGPHTLMLDAHMDEVGFLISYVESNGFLRFTTIGGWDPRIIPSHSMTVIADDGAKYKGVVGVPPPHITPQSDRERPHKLDDLFIDIGAESAEAVGNKGIRIGSPAVIAYPFEQLTDTIVRGKALDDRAGCAILIETLAALKGEELHFTVVANFAVAEEVGLRGAETAAYQIQPDVALAIEGTIAADTPGTNAAKQPTGFGKGPAISVLDNSLIVSSRMVKTLTGIADDNDIPWQYKVPAPGGTDAGAIHRSRAGVLAGVVSVPCRYIHSPLSLMRLDDFRNTVRLVTEFSRGGGEWLEI
jgi:tetrahedral aminopeptidase